MGMRGRALWVSGDLCFIGNGSHFSSSPATAWADSDLKASLAAISTSHALAVSHGTCCLNAKPKPGNEQWCWIVMDTVEEIQWGYHQPSLCHQQNIASTLLVKHLSPSVFYTILLLAWTTVQAHCRATQWLLQKLTINVGRLLHLFCWPWKRMDAALWSLTVKVY